MGFRRLRRRQTADRRQAVTAPALTPRIAPAPPRVNPTAGLATDPAFVRLRVHAGASSGYLSA
jgi:hypothetical protein